MELFELVKAKNHEEVAMDDKARLLELYEATGDPDAFTRAKPLYEQAFAGPEGSDPQAHLGYGYLLECHGRHLLRQAIEQYQRAIELDPDADKPRYQLISAQAALGEPEEAIALHTQRLAQSPTDVRERRFLSRACLAARDHAQAGSVIAAGLALDPDDRLLLEARGEVRAATGDPEGALADWRRAVDPDDNIGPVYSSTFLLERLGSLQEATAAWQPIINWCDAHDAPLTAQWPKRELERLRIRRFDG
jgi:tetratricopeptide (TPR) repeat protein